jgi:hypothetical protein
LRRKYGLEPLYREPLWGEPQKMKYLYAPAQLKRIPASEVELSRRRSAVALKTAATYRQRKKAVFSPKIDLVATHKMVA